MRSPATAKPKSYEDPQVAWVDNTSTETNFPQGFAQDYGFRSVRVP